MATLTKSGDRYILRSSYAEKDIPKQAGFRWDPGARQWYTTDPARAAKLVRYADSEALAAELGVLATKRNDTLAASRATDAPAEFHIPVPDGLSYLPYQRAGIYAAFRIFGAGFPASGCYGVDGATRNLPTNNEPATGSQAQSGPGKISGSTPQGAGAAGADRHGSGVEGEGVALHMRRDEKSGSACPASGGACQSTCELQGRQWAGTGPHCEAGGVYPVPTGIRSGVSDQNQGTPDRTEHSTPLQGGLRQPGDEGSGGNRWSFASAFGKKSSGLQEDGGTRIPGMESGQDRARSDSTRGCLLADEQGLGKTIQVIGVINADPSIKKILIICPASLRLNWARELEKWLVRPTTIGIVVGDKWPDTRITIINYDVLSRHIEALRAIEWDLIAVDEAHYLKSPDARRTQCVVGVEKRGQIIEPGLRSKRKMCLTGTPIPNRPVEGWPIFHWLEPDTFKSFWFYVKDFCAAKQSRYGWDFTGASNLDRLQERLRTSIMVRRRKSEVLTELPPKRRQIIELPRNGASGAVAAENAAWERQERTLEALRVAVELAKASEDPEDYEEAVRKLRASATAAFNEMSKCRHETALAKVPYVVEHLLASLEDPEHKVIVFAHHRDVISALVAAVAKEGIGVVSITGDTPMNARQSAVDSFQQDPATRCFIGNIQAAGVGLTLTASSHVIFSELDWVPGNVSQAEDRAHRIGQRESVLVQHLVLEGSLDARMARILVEKQRVIDAALDTAGGAAAAWEVERVAEPGAEPAERNSARPADDLHAVPVELPASHAATRDTLGEEAARMTPAQVEAVHSVLQVLAGYDTDHARDLNGIGFSKIDVAIGHRLAHMPELSKRQAALGRKIARKYRRQYSTGLYAAMFGESQAAA